MKAQTPSAVVHFQVHDLAELYMAYMPQVKYGGLFVNTTQRHQLGDEILIILTLPQATTSYHVAGKVVWLNPQNSREKGVGVMFNNEAKFLHLKNLIEQQLGKLLVSGKRTKTI